MSTENIDLNAIGSSLTRLERLPVAQKPLRGVLYGDYKTRQIGEGNDLFEMRPYETGDDFRDINWPATVRSPEGEIIVETFFAENAPAFYVASDIPGHRYQNDAPDRDERELGLGIAMLTTLMARRDGLPTSSVWSNGNKIFTGEEPNFDENSMISGFKKAVQLMREADHAAEATQSPKRSRLGFGKRKVSDKLGAVETVRLSGLLNKLGNVASIDSVVIVISDFRDVLDAKDATHGWARPLRQVSSANQVFAIELTNKWDFELPEGEVYFRNPSTGQTMSIDDIPNGRELYAAQEQERAANIARTIKNVGAQHVTINTSTKDWIGHFEKQMAKLREAS